jgi:hypothetical protein
VKEFSTSGGGEILLGGGRDFAGVGLLSGLGRIKKYICAKLNTKNFKWICVAPAHPLQKYVPLFSDVTARKGCW